MQPSGFAALAFALCAIFQLSGPLHYVLVPHEHCAEHGQLVHGDDAHHGGVHHDDATGYRAAQGSGHDGHDHCQVAANPRQLATLNAPEPGIAEASPTPTTTTQPSQCWVFVSALERAPKTSPPARG